MSEIRKQYPDGLVDAAGWAYARAHSEKLKESGSSRFARWAGARAVLELIEERYDIDLSATGESTTT